MSCLKAQLLPIPSLPFGASLEPPDLSLGVTLIAKLCCQIVVPIAVQVNLPGLELTADLLAPIQVFFLEVDAVLDLLELDCPFD